MDFDKSTKPVRKRTRNYTKEETDLLFRVVRPFRDIVSLHGPGQLKIYRRQQAWKKITQRFNAQTKDGPREMRHLVNYYKNAKYRLAKEGVDNSNDWVINSLVNKPQNNSVYDDVNLSDVPSVEPGVIPPEVARLLLSAETSERRKSVKSNSNNDGDDGYDDDDDDEIEFASDDDEIEETTPTEQQFIKIADVVSGKEPIDRLINIADAPAGKTSDPLNSNDGSKGKSTDSERPLTLYERKLEILQLQKRALEIEIEIKETKFRLELEDLKAQNEHNKEVRRKEMMLLDKRLSTPRLIKLRPKINDETPFEVV